MHRDPVGALCRVARPFFPARPPRVSQWRSILLLRPCCIGDVLQSTALLVALRRAFPEARLGYAVGPWSRPVLENNPHLDVLVDTGPVVGGRRQDWRAYPTLVRRLRRERWDACFVLERSPLFSLMAAAAGIPDRIGPDNAGRGMALTLRVPARPRRQEADAYLDLARAAGIEVAQADTAFFPSATDRDEVDRLVGDGQERFVALAPGGGVNPGGALFTKRWPAERLGALAARLARRGYTPLVVGGPQDHGLAKRVVEASEGCATDVSGRLSLRGCGALIDRAVLFVGNDTGLMHLAAATGTPVVALFGPTDPAIYAPYGEHHRVLWHPQRCSPCFRERERRQGCGMECMRSISVDEVEDAALELLG